MNTQESAVRIKILGIGGGGTNAVERMIDSNVPMVEYVTINTDDGSYLGSRAKTKVQIGRTNTNGRGAGADSEKGKLYAEKSAGEIEMALNGCEMLFITAGMGGGTGTGAAPVVAKIAKKLGILTVAVVTKPFSFEGGYRKKQAESGIKNLEQCVDAMIVIPNDNLKNISNSRITLSNAFAVADDVLVQTVKSLVELIQNTAFINCDFADITTILKNSGYVHVATGRAVGVDKTDLIIKQIKHSDLLDTSINGATGVLLYMSIAGNVALEDVDSISSEISTLSNEGVNFIFGLNFDERLNDEIRVLVVATRNLNSKVS